MSYEDRNEQLIAEGFKAFGKYMPESNEILDNTECVIVDESKFYKVASTMFGKIGLDYAKHDTKTLGASALKDGKGVIVINDDLHESDEEILMTMWHELGHFYADEHDEVTRILLSGGDMGTIDLGGIYIHQGYSFWKEFVAESIGYFILQKTGKYRRYRLGTISTKAQLNNVVKKSRKLSVIELVSNPYLYKYFSRIFADERFACLEKNSDGVIDESSEVYISAHQTTVSEIEHVNNQSVKMALKEIYSNLFVVMNKKYFWSTSMSNLYKLGESQFSLNVIFLADDK